VKAPDKITKFRRKLKRISMALYLKNEVTCGASKVTWRVSVTILEIILNPDAQVEDMAHNKDRMEVGLVVAQPWFTPSDEAA
jgi:hypothetical protein